MSDQVEIEKASIEALINQRLITAALDPFTMKAGFQITDPYKVKIGNQVADPYRISRAYNLDPVITQAVKKLLRRGRKHKDLETDVREAITTLERWEEMNREDNPNAETYS